MVISKSAVLRRATFLHQERAVALLTQLQANYPEMKTTDDKASAAKLL